VRSVHTITYTPADFASDIHSHIYGKTLPRFLTHVHTPVTNISHPNPRTVPGDQFQPYLHLPTICTCSLAVDNNGEYHMKKKTWQVLPLSLASRFAEADQVRIPTRGARIIKGRAGGGTARSRDPVRGRRCFHLLTWTTLKDSIQMSQTPRGTYQCLLHTNSIILHGCRFFAQIWRR
jgi:hypothetical protein